MATAPQLSPEPDRRVLRREKDQSASVSRSLFDSDDEREFTINEIKNERSTGRAETLHSSKDDRFPKYRNYFRYKDDALAHEIRVQFNNFKTKADLQQWVDQNVGFLENRKLSAQELEDVAFVSAAISKYGERYLEEQYARGRMSELRNRVPLESSDCRNEYMQQVKRNESTSEYLDEKEAAHYIGVEVGFAVNDRLPIGQRLGEELRLLVSQTTNMRMVLKKTNREFHVKVDNLLLNPDKYLADRYLTDAEHERIKQTAKYAQSETVQGKLVEAKGQHFYMALRDLIKAMDKHHNFTETLWDGRKDKKELVRSDSAQTKPKGVRKTNRGASLGESKQAKPPAKSPANARSTMKEDSQEAKTTTMSASNEEAKVGSTDAKPSRKAKSEAKKSAVNAPQPVAGVHLKSDGTPDRRFKENKAKPTRSQENRSDLRPVTHSTSDDLRTRSHRSAWSEQENTQTQPAKSNSSRSNKGREDETLYTGPRGGTYYLNSSGNKSYVKPEQAYSPPSPVSSYASSSSGGGFSSYSSSGLNSKSNSSSSGSGGGDRVLLTGPRGGTYYINANGNKTYVK